eukprot:CAMPEP_0117662788 /NCGR_PEP_ID=MMETSP0804-20121206/8237_1 /TAXON_ID=1074897 /ORGANISM="Tetraselmis astigmatica, Strain CCMP880" /LENGTH=680 /DNA_ID=CAMNT_0005469705 /DNA_START=314 /DNA_END=2356 /DNA_ORIENTATION=-
MKSFLKSLGGRGDDAGSLVGQQLQVGPYELKVESKLAEGGYATIYRVRDTAKGLFALKQIRVQGNSEALEEVKVEARVMQLLRGHPHVLKLHAVCLSGPKGSEDCLMLLDLCEGSLVGAAHRRQLDPASSLQAFHHLCKAIAHMHAQRPPLCHRDVKPENLLRHPGGRWVLCDFGSATSRAQVYSGAEMYVEEERIRKYTTPAYRAPEMWDLLCNERVDTQADIWALGCVLYWLTFAKLAFTGDSKLGVLNGNYEMPPSGGSEPVRQLIKDMLVVDPKNRPDITVVLARIAHMQGGRGGAATPAPAEQTLEVAGGGMPLPWASRGLSGGSPVAAKQHTRQPSQPPVLQQSQAGGAAGGGFAEQQGEEADGWVADFGSPTAAFALVGPAENSGRRPSLPPSPQQPATQTEQYHQPTEPSPSASSSSTSQPSPPEKQQRRRPGSASSTPGWMSKGATNGSGGRYRLKSPAPLLSMESSSSAEAVPPSTSVAAPSAPPFPGHDMAASHGHHLPPHQGLGPHPAGEPIVVAPSSAHLPRAMSAGVSEAGSGTSTPKVSTPTTETPCTADAPGPEVVAALRRQLAEAQSSNATLQRRVAQLESMLRSQAATISALHHAQQQQQQPQGEAVAEGGRPLVTSPPPTANGHGSPLALHDPPLSGPRDGSQPADGGGVQLCGPVIDSRE